eukprot:scaffold8717_cov260-Chaetoceros_neogracile.AAC.7
MEFILPTESACSLLQDFDHAVVDLRMGQVVSRRTTQHFHFIGGPTKERMNVAAVVLQLSGTEHMIVSLAFAHET